MDEIDDYARAYGMCILVFSIVMIIGLIIFSIYVKMTGNYPVE